MEFSHVVLAGVQAGKVPLERPTEAFADDVARHEHEQTERALFYVASTRARDTLLITGVGEPSPFVSSYVASPSA